MDLKETFLNIYNNLPLNVRDEVVLVVNGEAISWKVAKNEIDNNTKLSLEILQKLHELSFI